MKYGVLRYVQQFLNIGDVFQSIGMENMYKQCGIEDEDIIYLDKRRLSEYSGEYVIVPLAANCDYWEESKMFPLPDRIIPIFFGFRCVDEFHLRHMEKYKNSAIFGCRDVYNMEYLRKNGYKSYVSGCMSLQVGRKRERLPKGTGKIVVVDAQSKIESYIPEEMKERIVRYTNKFWRYDLSLEEAAVFEETEARKRLTIIKEEAELVITGRLHCALPCLALGIPVILALSSDGLENRYSGYSDYIDIYTPDQFDSINWNPVPKDISFIQDKQVELFKRELDKVKEQWGDYCELSSIFESSKKLPYYNGTGSSNGYLSQWEIKQFINNNVLEKNYLSYVFKRKLHEIHLIIWGAGDKGKWCFGRYRDSFLMCKSVIYVDKNEEKQKKVLNGCRILNPDVIHKYPLQNTKVIVALNSSLDPAAFEVRRQLVSEFSMEEGKDFFLLDKLNATARYFVDDFGTFGWMDERVWN